MDQGVARVRVEEMERAISEVAEVQAARVILDAVGDVSEIHVLATPGKQPKQLVRDVESALQARLGISIDHRVVSVAQLGRGAESDKSPRRHVEPVRPRIVGVSASAAGVQAAASVTLEIDGSEYTGTASGPGSETGRMRHIAAAALDAINSYISAGTTFALEDVAIVQLGRERAAVACVTQLSTDGERHFTGSALLRQNEMDSIVRATLNATNRRMGLLTTE